MWIYCKDGFFSAVQNHDCQDDEVMVRAQSKKDIERLATATRMTTSDILITPTSDYAFRLKLAKQVWADYLQQSACDIDYPDFKSTCTIGER